MGAARSDRRFPKDRPADQRSASERDRDRILNTTAFRRLAGVTQVVSAAEGHVFHNRLTHSLEVAQIARRLAEHWRRRQPGLAEELGGIDPETAESAALAHDLGHPPFGHIAERELDDVVRANGVDDGFEGNAQSFRIVTRLAVRSLDFEGLNLARATLNAILKYPWHRDGAHPKRSVKWGAYVTEDDDFAFARQGLHDGLKSVEAELMDWADDIAYAVHDLEDFYRAGLLPIDRLIREPEQHRFLDAVIRYWDSAGTSHPGRGECERALTDLFATCTVVEAYSGNRSQRAALRTWTSFLVGRYFRAIELRRPTAADPATVLIKPQMQTEVTLLKQLTWQYVILNPALAAQQHGQRRVIRELFEIYHSATKSAAHSAERKILPASFREILDRAERSPTSVPLEHARVRIAADIVSSMTEQQAVAMYLRLRGIEPGSVLNPILS